MDKSHGPITDQYKQAMNDLAAELDGRLRGAGFVLLVFDDKGPDPRSNYIANRPRATMLTALKEVVARFEGRVVTSGTKQ